VAAVLLLAGHDGEARLALDEPRAEPRAEQRDEQRTEQMVLYLKAEQTLKQGQRGFFRRHRAALRDYPLYPYLQARDLAADLGSVETQTVAEFLASHEATPIAAKLRSEWLKHLAAQREWRLFIQHYRRNAYQADNTLACLYAHALLQTQNYAQLQEPLEALWLVNFSQPRECDDAFRWGLQSQAIDQELIWQRLLLVLNSGRIKLADYLATHLDGERRSWYVLFKQSYYDPLKALAAIQQRDPSSPFVHQLLLYSIAQAKRHDLDAADRLWRGLRQHFTAYPAIYAQAQSMLGVAACRQLRPKLGLEYLAASANASGDPKAPQWRIRCALRAQQWSAVLAAIAALDAEERQHSRWRYWQARAYHELGRSQQAARLWRRVAAEASYYGYLSADKIGGDYALSVALPKVKSSHLKRVEDLAALQRTRELLALGQHFAAKRELLYLLPRLQPAARIKVALLCRQWGWANGAIQALADEMFWHKQLGLRFPLAYREVLSQQARRFAVPVHWLYAVTRRESAFIADVKSPAGALGLMQLMPRTAREVARRLKRPTPSAWTLIQPAANAQMATAYLDHLYQRHDRRWVLTLAAYNAGPHRVKEWLSQAAVDDAEIWVETIPFTETRHYVQAVLFYAVVYHYQLTQKVLTLQSIMPLS